MLVVCRISRESSNLAQSFSSGPSPRWKCEPVARLGHLHGPRFPCGATRCGGPRVHHAERLPGCLGSPASVSGSLFRRSLNQRGVTHAFRLHAGRRTPSPRPQANASRRPTRPSPVCSGSGPASRGRWPNRAGPAVSSPPGRTSRGPSRGPRPPRVRSSRRWHTAAASPTFPSPGRSPPPAPRRLRRRPCPTASSC